MAKIPFHNMANLLSLPEHIMLYIVSLLAKSGIEYLGPLIASGPEGFRVCMNMFVLREASLGIIEARPVLVNRGTIFRHIFERTLRVRNPVSIYLEALRNVVRHTGIRDAIIQLSNPWGFLFGKHHPSSSMTFILIILVLCEGDTDHGIDLMMKFRASFTDVTEIEAVEQRVYNDMRAIGGEPFRRRREAFKKFTMKIPSVPYFWDACCEVCGQDKLCPRCYTFLRCQMFKDMFLF